MAQPQAPNVSFTAGRSVAGPGPSAGELIHNLGNTAGQAIKDAQVARVENRFSNIADASTTVGEITDNLIQQGKSPQEIQSTLNEVASFDPSKQQVIPGLNLPPDLQNRLLEVKKQAGKAFSAIAQGVAQGATTRSAAAIALESKVRELVNETPGFGPEIRAMATKLAGFDPSGYVLRQILDVNVPKGPSAPLTAWDKMQQDAEAIQNGLAANGTIVPLHTILGNLALSKQKEAEFNAADAQLKVNNISFGDWVNKTITSHGPDLGSVLMKIATVGKAGGITQPQEYLNVIQQQKLADKQSVLQRASTITGGVSQDQLNQAWAAIDA